MNFLIVTHAEHKKNDLGQVGGYAPYVREMNLWGKYVGQITIVAPLIKDPFSPIDILYSHPNVKFVAIPEINFASARSMFYALLMLPRIFWIICQQMRKADHIHLRCPGNIGLLGCIAQFFFPRKKKTAKYAGNWDWKSKQPISYRLQQRMLRSTWFMRNMQVLVYGHWPNATSNIVPFFTATYSQQDFEISPPRDIGVTENIRLVFVGAFSTGKKPLLSVQVAELLAQKGLHVCLDMFGEGPEKNAVEAYVTEKRLHKIVQIHGNQNAETVKGYFKNAHFLVFISRSEGWPKVVAESMFWGCVPITSRVSCVPEMIGEGLRGALVEPDIHAIADVIFSYVNDPVLYKYTAAKAMDWSRQFTLERFEAEIAKLL